MSHNLSANLYVGVRSFTEILEIYCLPIPKLDEGSSGTAYVADAQSVRHWVRRSKALWAFFESGRGPIGPGSIDIRFLMMMQVIQSDIDRHVLKDSDWQLKPFPEQGVPDDYRAVFV